MTQRKPRLVVFSDDWGRHPSSAQHLVAKLLADFDVDWVNTVGTRRPNLSVHDLKRAAEKLKSWLQPASGAMAEPATPAPSSELPSPTVHSPMHWPGFGSRLERALNKRLLLRALKGVLSSDAAPSAVITTAPITADLAAALPELRWIYYCVDDLSEWPGLDGDALREMELDMLPHMTRIIAVSEHLIERLEGLGHEAQLLTHGIDLEHWSGIERRAVPELGTRPRAVYWGHADRRLDSGVCAALARRVDLDMVGPATDVDPLLLQDPNIRWLGSVPYAELPRVAAGADVLVMPYADLPVTRAMQPLKLKEYLATGLPVVATPLPANLEWQAAMDLCADPLKFAELVELRARAELPEAQRMAREALASESWGSKAQLFERLAMGESE